jgi:hypothetical protein
VKLHHIVISSPTGLPDDASVTIDGNRVEGLYEVGLSMRSDAFAEVRLTLIASVEADVQMVERVFEAPKESNG